MRTSADPTDRTRRRLAWAAPVVVAAAIGAVTVTATHASGASPDVPKRSAAQLLTAIQTHNATTFSGTISETANLGLPALPGVSSRASLSWQTFITGTHSAKVWAAGPTKQRVALVGELSEAEVVHNGADLWTYTSDTNTVTHTTLTGKDRTAAPRTPSAADATPSAVSAQVLKAITPTTRVSVDPARMVAGRAAYVLVLQPSDSASTVHSVRIAVDAKSYLPLRVQIFGSASTPAFSTGFTTISYARPSAGTFVFHSPAGATTTKDPLDLQGQGGRAGHHERHAGDGHHTATRPGGHTGLAHAGTTPAGDRSVIGTGWTAVVELPAGSSALAGGTLVAATTAVGSTGSRLLHTALINAVIRADGRTFVGAVSPAVLEHIAATH